MTYTYADRATYVIGAASAVAFAAIVLSGCTPSQEAAVVSYEAKAAPIVASACAKFRAAEANPLVQVAVAGGTIAANEATGGVAGPVVAAVKGYGDVFCSIGPPAGDASTPAQQAAWLNQQVTGQLVAAAQKPASLLPPK